MSLKLKALGLSLLAALAVSAVAVVNAAANGEGHFESDVDHTIIKGSEAGTHTVHLIDKAVAGEIGCDIDNYSATTTTKTVTSITVTASYADCYTTKEEPNKDEIDVTMNGCTYTFTVAKNSGNLTEQTVHLLCPGTKVEVHHPACTITIPQQTVNTGITYTRVTENGKHAITMHVDAEFAIERHGLCRFVLPKNGVGTLFGSVTVQGFNTTNEPVHITHT